MSALVELQLKIQDTTAAMAQLERLIMDTPDLPSLLANTRSLEKRLRNLEHQFRAEADQVGVDVCRYRVFANGSQPTLLGFAGPLIGFQNLVSLTYGAIIEGAKPTAHLKKEVVKESTFGFGYAFSGSLGVVLTLPNERLLFDEVATALDRAIESIFNMAKAETSDDIRGFARTLGAAPVRALYRWANDHVRADAGADIEWRRAERVRASLFVQRPELERLSKAIEVTSDTRQQQIVLEGDLVGADVPNRTFHMKVGNTEVRGKFSDAIGPEHTVVLPRPYKATIQVTTWTHYAADKDDVANFLVALEPLTPS